MKKAMIITVGTGKIREDIAHAICFSIKQQNPDYILFILTQKSKEETMPHILKDEVMENRKYEEKILLDENDIEKIATECRSFIKEIIKKNYKPKDIVCDYTSGTKAMSSGLTISAIAENIGTLVYISGKRDKEGRVISGTERAIPLTPNEIYANSLFEEAVKLFNDYQFDFCIRIVSNAKNLYSEERFQQKLNTLENLATAYSKWDKFDLDEAFNKLNNLKKEEEELLKNWGIKNKIENHKQFLYEEKNNRFCFKRMIDLFENSKRRAKEYKFDDATARLYRTLEYIAQYKINEYELYKDNTTELNLDKLQPSLRNKYKERIGLEEDYKLLNDLNNKLEKEIKEICESLTQKDSNLKKLLQLRNNSILAHGFQPITKENYEEMSNEIENYLKKIIPDFEDLIKIVEFPNIKL